MTVICWLEINKLICHECIHMQEYQQVTTMLNRIQLDAVHSPIYFTAETLYMFRVSTPIIRSTKTCNRSLRYRS